MNTNPTDWQECPGCKRECFAWRETCPSCNTMMPNVRPLECDVDQLLIMLRGLISGAASMRAWCRKNGFNVGQISEVSRGKRKMPTRVANALGYKEIIMYRKHED